jgi:hypothetical protein
MSSIKLTSLAQAGCWSYLLLVVSPPNYKASVVWDALSTICNEGSSDIAEVLSSKREQEFKDTIAECRKVDISQVDGANELLETTVENGINHLMELVIGTNLANDVPAVEKHMLEIMNSLLAMTSAPQPIAVDEVPAGGVELVTPLTNKQRSQQVLDAVSDFIDLASDTVALKALGEPEAAVCHKLFGKMECALRSSLEKSRKSLVAARGEVESSFNDAVTARFDAAEVLLVRFKTEVQARKLAAITKSLVPLEKIARGAKDSKHWYEGLAAGATFLGIKRAMESTIATITKPKELVTAIGDVAKVGCSIR